MGRAVLRSCRQRVVECCGDNNNCRPAATIPHPGSQTTVMGVIRRSKGVTMQQSWAVSYTAGLYTKIRKRSRVASASLQRRPWRKLKRVVSGLTMATSVSKEPNRKLNLITISLSMRIKSNKQRRCTLSRSITRCANTQMKATHLRKMLPATKLRRNVVEAASRNFTRQIRTIKIVVPPLRLTMSNLPCHSRDADLSLLIISWIVTEAMGRTQTTPVHKWVSLSIEPDKTACLQTFVWLLRWSIEVSLEILSSRRTRGIKAVMEWWLRTLNQRKESYWRTRNKKEPNRLFNIPTLKTSAELLLLSSEHQNSPKHVSNKRQLIWAPKIAQIFLTTTAIYMKKGGAPSR